jgi:hypothetical protein
MAYNISIDAKFVPMLECKGYHGSAHIIIMVKQP